MEPFGKPRGQPFPSRRQSGGEAPSREIERDEDPSHRPDLVLRPESDVLVSQLDRSAFEGTDPPRKVRRPKAQATACDCCLTDPETGVASGRTKAAICVQDVDVQCVLQFTLIHAAGCALHRHTSRVIHRLELYFRSEKQKGSAALPRQLLDKPPRLGPRGRGRNSKTNSSEK